MCLLIAVKSGVDKSSDILFDAIRTGATTNTDGIGYAFKKSKQNKIWISKGFQDVDKFITTLQKKHLKPEDELIVHLRIGNKGAKTVEMNHPFVISDDADTILSNDEYVQLPVLAHNGTFHSYSITNSQLSDTFYFTKDFMSIPEIQSLLKRDTDTFKRIFTSTLGINRLALLFPDNTPLITLGNFIESEGYLFSNESYKKKVYNVGGYESWDDERYATSRGGGQNISDGCWQNGVYHSGSKYPVTHSSIPINTPHKDTKWLDRDDEDEDVVIANKKFCKVGERKRDVRGFLQADPKFDIIPPTTPFWCIFNKATKQWYDSTEGNIAYVPRAYPVNQFDRTFFTPTVFNYTHFTYYSPIGDSIKGINPTKRYRIYNFDSRDPRGATSKGVHLVNEINSYKNGEPLYGTTVRSLWLTTESLVELFIPQLESPKLTLAYRTLYRLMHRFSTPSKNLMNATEKAIRGAEKNGKESNINFKNQQGLELLGLKLFYNYLLIDLLPFDQARLKFLEVQDLTPDNTVSYKEALEALNN